MKKFVIKVLTISALVMLPAFSFAQDKMNIHLKNGTVESIPVSDIDWVDWTTDDEDSPTPDPDVSDAYLVDLGLSVKWASCNLGASSPEEFGDFYSWGETKPKTAFSKLNYFDLDKDTWKYLKYNKDAKTTLDLTDDAAFLQSDGKCRIPTYEECMELIENCTWTRTEQNGVSGLLCVGPSGNSIFLPATGWYFGNDLEECTHRSDEGTIGDYMTNGLYYSKFGYGSNVFTSFSDNYAFSLSFEGKKPYMFDKRRVDGIPIRPVSNSPQTR